MLQEAAHELLTSDGAGAPAVGFAVLVAERDGVVVEADDARISDGNAKDVTGQVSEHCVFALTPGGDPDDPRRCPGGGGDDEVGALLRKVSLELSAHELGNGRLGSKEGGTGRMPARRGAN